MESQSHLYSYLLFKISSISLNNFSWDFQTLKSWLCESVHVKYLLKWVPLFFVCLFYPYFYSSIFFNVFSFKLWPAYPESRSPYFLTLPSTKLSHSVRLMGIVVSCHLKGCCESQSTATQCNIFLILGDGQRSRWHIILSHTYHSGA